MRTTIKAQELYDVRSLAGDIGGTELQLLFLRIVKEHSPKGQTNIERSDLLNDHHGKILLDRLESPLASSVKDIKNYLDIS